jgi:hypothetical protein
LNEQVDKTKISCLNYDQKSVGSLADVLTGTKTLQSDCDEQLLLSFQFHQLARLHSIKFEAPPTNGPKTIKLFINRPHMGFDEAESIEPAQVLSLTADDFSANKATALRFVKFQNVPSITVFIQDNQDGSDVSALKRITFIGSLADKQTDFKNFKSAGGDGGEQ